MSTVVVFGGGGFLGRRLVRRLTAEGMTVRVAVRHPDPARVELRALGFDRVTVVPADVRDQASVAAAIAGTDAVVNTVSAYVEQSGVTFEAPCSARATHCSAGSPSLHDCCRYCRSSAEVAPDYSQSSSKTWQRLSPAYLPTLEPSAESTSLLVPGYTRCASWSR